MANKASKRPLGYGAGAMGPEGDKARLGMLDGVRSPKMADNLGRKTIGSVAMELQRWKKDEEYNALTKWRVVSKLFVW